MPMHPNAVVGIAGRKRAGQALHGNEVLYRELVDLSMRGNSAEKFDMCSTNK